jgi:hypothetical protein
MKEEEQEGQQQFAKEIQGIILDKIDERKRRIHPSHSIVFNDNVRLQIQTLEWVLSEIRSLQRRRTMSSASASTV